MKATAAADRPRHRGNLHRKLLFMLVMCSTALNGGIVMGFWGGDTLPRMTAMKPLPMDSESPPAIAGFRIERLLGVGGMSRVWLAVQLSTGRVVALKVLD